MKKHAHPFFTFLLAILLLSLTACGKHEDTSLTEGDCTGVVAFTEIPKEFSLLDQDFMDRFSVAVTLENINNEKFYHISLSPENKFRQELSLHPGTYRVVSVYANQMSDLGIRMEASAQSLTFEPDRQAILTVTVSNPEEFKSRWMEVQPMPEILIADKYSGLIQINRKVIPIQEILPELEITNLDTNTIDNLNAYEKLTLIDREKGIQVHILNSTEEPLHWSECTVTGITVTGNTVLFPDGISVDSLLPKVCHRQTGLYGEPTKVTGSFLFGWGLAENSAVYSDPVSGNRITLNINSEGSHIRSISYDLAVFE